MVAFSESEHVIDMTRDILIVDHVLVSCAVGRVVTLIVSSGPRVMLDVNLDNQVFLIACDLVNDSLRPGETLRLVLYWRALQQIPESYIVFVHVARADGTTLVQRDVQPGDGAHPTSSWVTGEVVTDSHELSIPGDALPDIYWLKAGMYSPATMQRLPVVDPGEATVLQDSVLVKELRVVPAQQSNLRPCGQEEIGTFVQSLV